MSNNVSQSRIFCKVVIKIWDKLIKRYLDKTVNLLRMYPKMLTSICGPVQPQGDHSTHCILVTNRNPVGLAQFHKLFPKERNMCCYDLYHFTDKVQYVAKL